MNEDTSLYWLLNILVIIVVFLLLARIAQFCNFFSRELKRLNTEIGRTKGTEREHWLRRRRRLWLSLIPFVKY